MTEAVKRKSTGAAKGASSGRPGKADKTTAAVPPPSSQHTASPNRLDQAASSIRDQINDPPWRHRLTKNHKEWNEIVSSLDAIGDTEAATGAYFDHYPVDVGARYLFLYGVLQALTIQQDAVRHLSEALNGDVSTLDKDPRLADARRIRIAAAGHPTRKDRPKGRPVTSQQVARITLGPGGFMMLTADEHGGMKTDNVDLVSVLTGHRAAITEILEALDAKMKAEDRALRAAHSKDPLTAVFPPTLGYSLEKLWDGIRSGHPFGQSSLDEVKKTIAAFAEALARRGLSTAAYPGVKEWYAEIEHPLRELEAFYEGRSTLHPRTALIVACHVADQLKLLQRMAYEIDQEWKA